MKQFMLASIAITFMVFPGSSESAILSCSDSPSGVFTCTEDEQDQLYVYSWGHNGSGQLTMNSSYNWLAYYECGAQDDRFIKIDNTVTFNIILVSSDFEYVPCEVC